MKYLTRLSMLNKMAIGVIPGAPGPTGDTPLNCIGLLDQQNPLVIVLPRERRSH